MRYIRTKDGKFYDTTEWKNIRETHSLIVLMNKDRESVLLYKADIVKQADTIEELCDEFVLKATIDGQTEYLHDKNLKILEICKIAHEGTGYSCETYGAIWTEKGLIYVAQMNNEGVLKLL